MVKKIWIDVTNSPHVLFFRPIIKNLEKRGFKVIVTARDFAQTYDLLDQYNIKYYKFGKYAGNNLFKKILFLITRSIRLLFFSIKHKFHLSLSHNSIDICIVSWISRIPIIDIFDYEYAQFHHINFRCATKIVCPKYINSKDLYKFGVNDKKIIKYDGLKEQMYLSDYNFDNKILKKLNIDSKKIIVVFRPPAEKSLYHKGIKNNIYLDLINYLSNKKNVVVVYLGRDVDQINLIKSNKYNNFIIPVKAIDAPSLIKQSDLVISAGGTMNREACALGTPVYTILALKIGGVDKYLLKKGYLKKLKTVKNIMLVKKNKAKKLKSTNISKFVDLLFNSLKRSKK